MYHQYVRIRSYRGPMIEHVEFPVTDVSARCRVAEDRDQYGCFFFNERRATELTLLLGVVPTIFAVFQLMKVRDVFGIGPEIIRVIIPILLGVGASCPKARIENTTKMRY